MEKSLIQELERGLFYLEENNRSVREFLFYKDQINVLIEALDEYGRYKWHDLRKDPEDVPELERKILICYMSGQNDLYMTWRTNENDLFPMFIKPEAWMYIDRFVEVKDGKLGSN